MTDSAETKPPKPKKLVSSDALMAAAIREDAQGHRALASRLLGAELAGDWAAVKEVRAALVEIAFVLEALAEKHDR